jgi:hypothetical protein
VARVAARQVAAKPEAGQPTDRELRTLLRASDLLDPPLKRQWLRVLPYLSLDDRRRLRSILSGEDQVEIES